MQTGAPLTSDRAAPKGAQVAKHSVPSTPPSSSPKKRRTGDPAACWAKLSRPAQRDGSTVADTASQAPAFRVARDEPVAPRAGCLVGVPLCGTRVLESQTCSPAIGIGQSHANSEAA